MACKMKSQHMFSLAKPQRSRQFHNIQEFSTSRTDHVVILILLSWAWGEDLTRVKCYILSFSPFTEWKLWQSFSFASWIWTALDSQACYPRVACAGDYICELFTVQLICTLSLIATGSLSNPTATMQQGVELIYVFFFCRWCFKLCTSLPFFWPPLLWTRTTPAVRGNTLQWTNRFENTTNPLCFLSHPVSLIPTFSFSDVLFLFSPTLTRGSQLDRTIPLLLAEAPNRKL